MVTETAPQTERLTRECDACNSIVHFPGVWPSNVRCPKCREMRWALRTCPCQIDDYQRCNKRIVALLGFVARLECPECGGCWMEVMDGPQTDFVNSTARYPALVSGRGGGKTIASVVKAFKFVAEHPGAIGILTEPTYGKVDEILIPSFESCYGHLKGTEWDLKVGKYEIHFSAKYNNSKIYLRPAEDPEKIPGGNIAFFGMDEVKVGLQHETFMLLAPSLRQPGFPRQGWISTTPDWRRPWIRKRWKEHIHPTDGHPLSKDQYKLFQANTVDNWHNPEDYQELLFDDYGATLYADQELGGAFIIVEGAGFPMFDASIHVREAPNDMVWKESGGAGLDFGITSPTSMHEVCLDRSNRAWVTREFYQRDADDYDWVRAFRDWGLKSATCDPSRSEDDLKKLRRLYGVAMKRARFKEFDIRVKMISRRLAVREDGKPGMYISPTCVNLIQEIQNAAFEQPRGQDYTVDKWMSGTSDHALDDVGYKLMDFDLPPPDYNYRPRVERRGWNY